MVNHWRVADDQGLFLIFEKVPAPPMMHVVKKNALNMEACLLGAFFGVCC